jgi:hypothetical protein
MNDYTQKAEEFLKDQGIPDKHVYTVHKMGGKVPVHLSFVLSQYEDYLQGFCAEQNLSDTIDEITRNAGAIS